MRNRSREKNIFTSGHFELYSSNFCESYMPSAVRIRVKVLNTFWSSYKHLEYYCILIHPCNLSIIGFLSQLWPRNPMRLNFCGGHLCTVCSYHYGWCRIYLFWWPVCLHTYVVPGGRVASQPHCVNNSPLLPSNIGISVVRISHPPTKSNGKILWIWIQQKLSMHILVDNENCVIIPRPCLRHLCL